MARIKKEITDYKKKGEARETYIQEQTPSYKTDLYVYTFLKITCIQFFLSERIKRLQTLVSGAVGQEKPLFVSCKNKILFNQYIRILLMLKGY